jgi:hypothetical protein
MEREKYSCNKKAPKKLLQFKSLKFKRCVFMTDEQYNKAEIHKPKESLFVEKLIMANSTDDIDIAVNDIINDIHTNFNNIYPGKKLPNPIYVMIGRELVHNKDLFTDETFLPLPLSFSPTVPYGKTNITKKGFGLAIIEYINGFFNSGFSNKNDVYKYETSMIKSYEFEGRVRIFVYVPCLTNKYKLISNIYDLTNTFFFLNTLITSNYYMNIERTSTFNADKFRKEMTDAKIDNKFIEFIVNMIISFDSVKYPLYDDLMNLCIEGGCVTNIGDDFNTLLPPYTEDEDTNNKNATEKSPFMPNKCLSKTNGYLCNIRFANKNVDIHEFIKKNALKEIQENLSNYTLILDKSNKNINLTKEELDYLTKYTSPVNLIVSVINNFIKKYYSVNLNEDKKDDIKLNHYSKLYSENIIKELSFLKKMNGIPEMVMSLYLYNEGLNKDKIMLMPFGNVLPSNENVFTFNSEKLYVDSILYSFNKEYGMKLISNGYIFVYNIETNGILYFLNRNKYNNPQYMEINEAGLFITYKNEKTGNESSENCLSKIKLIEKNCEPIFSLVINDDGFINIYGNAYCSAISVEFKSFINDEMAYVKSIKPPLNYNNMTNLENILNKNKNTNVPYTYCKSEGCQ